MRSTAVRIGLGLLFAAIAVAGVVLWTTAGDRSAPVAIAGPCAADPTVAYEGIPTPDDGIFTMVMQRGDTARKSISVGIVPNPLPLGKQATISISPQPLGWEFNLDPPSAGGSFSTTLTIRTFKNALVGVHIFNVTATCHPGDPRTLTFQLEINLKDDCERRPQALPQGNPSPTPPPPGSTCRIWGDVDCDLQVDSSDALTILKEIAGVTTPTPQVTPSPPPPTASPAPPAPPCFLWKVLTKIADFFQRLPAGDEGLEVEWGDFNCSGSAGPDDALSVLRQLQEFEEELPAGCPPVGASAIILEE